MVWLIVKSTERESMKLDYRETIEVKLVVLVMSGRARPDESGLDPKDRTQEEDGLNDNYVLMV